MTVFLSKLFSEVQLSIQSLCTTAVKIHRQFGGQDNTYEFLFAGGSYTAVPTSGDRKNRNKPTRGRKKSIFEAYMSKEDVSAGLKRGELIQVPGTYNVCDLVISLWKSQAVVGNECLLVAWKGIDVPVVDVRGRFFSFSQEVLEVEWNVLSSAEVLFLVCMFCKIPDP